MFREMALRISQKVLIGVNQLYRLYYVGVCNDLPSKNLVNPQKKKNYNIFSQL